MISFRAAAHGALLLVVVAATGNLASSGTSAGAPPARTPLRAAAASADPEFGAHWHDGKAELDGYALTVQRYGQPRVGQAVMVFVTEPFRLGARVKADDTTLDPADVTDVLKLNLVRDFQTGIYDYDTMVSLFARSDTFEPLKVSFSSAEWCGHVYEELLVDPHRIRQRLSSYFEGESTSGILPRPPGGMLEEELFVRLRGLRGAFLPPGGTRSVPFLASTFHRRMTHQSARWTRAAIARAAAARPVRVPAGEIAASEYVVRVTDGRVGRFDVESSHPHRIVRWSWSAPRGASPSRGLGGEDGGELTGTARLAYWKLHGNGDERILESLGLAPSVAKRQ